MTLNEQLLSGCILLDDDVIFGLDGIVRADDIEDPRCRAIFIAANEIKNEGGKVQPPAILEKARHNGTEIPYEFVTQLWSIVPTAANFAEYGERVAEDAKRRRIKNIAAQIVSDDRSNSTELVATLQQELDKFPADAPLQLVCASDVDYKPPKSSSTLSINTLPGVSTLRPITGAPVVTLAAIAHMNAVFPVPGSA